MSYILIIVLMVILSAFFSASEISFNASNKMRLKKAADAGSSSAALAYKISEDFTTALSAILIGNNLANIAASTAATVITMNLLLSLKALNSDGIASLVSTVVMTLIILIFGEIVPKIIAKNNADAAVRLFAWPTRILTWILFPLVWLVMLLVRLLSSLWGKDDEDAPTVTEEELSSIIETVEEEGVIDEDKSELLQSAIDFRDTTVEEIMTPRIDMTAFDIADSQEEIEQLVDESRYSRIPVYEDSIDNIIGILYLNHYYKKLAEVPSGEAFSLRSVLMTPCFIHKTMRLPAALSLLREKKTHLAIVVDEFGGTLGLVTMEDILEELVGDIWDETDEIVHDCVKTGENTYEVTGDMNIDDFFHEIEFEPKDFECEYSTVGGWAIEMLDADPHVGDSFSFRDIPPEDEEDDDPENSEATVLTVVVTGMDDMRVTKLTVLVERPKPDEEED
ncbi:MAG: HlyC/CorC family transporter [Clostridia bacterium]|nr:HlyC/CorC family transporter [Clostridia bacterium]